jgi:hypothetical protein
MACRLCVSWGRVLKLLLEDLKGAIKNFDQRKERFSGGVRVSATPFGAQGLTAYRKKLNPCYC